MRVSAALTRWRTALLAGLVLGVVFGVVEGFSIFYAAFVVDLALDRADASGMYAVYLLASVIAAPVGARLVRQVGPRRVIVTAFPVFALAIGACAGLTSLWQFYLIYVLALAGTTTLLVVASQVLINASYVEDRGKATGIAYACLGVGDFLLFTFLGSVVELAGWRTGYLISGVLSLIGTGVFAWLTRRSPEPSTPEEEPSEPAESARRVLLVNPALWLACGFALMGSVTDFFTFQTVVPYLTANGWGTSLAGYVLGLAGLSYAGGQLTGGAISDRWSREVVAAGSALVFLVGLVGLWSLPGLLLLTVSVVLLGFSVGCIIGCRVAAVGDLFAGPLLSSATGVVHVASAIGSAFATWFGGLSFSLNGNYDWSFAVAGACACLWVVALVLAAPRRARCAALARKEEVDAWK